VNVISLFSGIGGLDLGLQRAGMTIVGQVEIDPWCRSILQKHWPEVPRHDDVRTAAEWWGDRPAPGLVCGGFPCQPVSVAGLKRAQEDPRWLWPPMAAFIGAVRPDWLLIENVPGLRKLGLADVLRDLHRLGYRTRPGYISACEMGATHPRKRLLTMAHAASVRCGQGRPRGPDLDAPSRTSEQAPVLAHTNRVRPDLAGRGWWDTEPGVDRMAHGIPHRVDRLRGLGNAVVPQVAEHIGRLIMEAAA
jgi:DNA (cytosine-5)-methyltransferase 1